MGFGAKLLIVANLVATVALLMANFSTYFKKIELIESLQAVTIKYNELQAKARADDADAKRQIALLTTDRDSFKNQLNHKQTENVHLTENLRKESDNLAQTRGDLQNRELENRRLNDRVEELTSKLDEKDLNLAEAFKERDKNAAEAKTRQAMSIETLTELHSSQERINQLEMHLAELGTALIAMKTQNDALARGTSTALDPLPPVNPIRGMVVQVSEEIETVILNVGEKDNVKPGMRFMISDGDSYVAEVQVKDVEQRISSANIVRGMKKKAIEVNNRAQTM